MIDERWREREAERLANWAKVEMACAGPDQTTTVWAKLLPSKSSIDTTVSAPDRHNSTHSKDAKKSTTERWASVLEKMQKNKYGISS